jgi:hypothetical protein
MTRQLDAAVDVALEIERELRVLTPDKPTLRCFIAECLARGDATYEEVEAVKERLAEKLFGLHSGCGTYIRHLTREIASGRLPEPPAKERIGKMYWNQKDQAVLELGGHPEKLFLRWARKMQGRSHTPIAIPGLGAGRGAGGLGYGPGLPRVQASGCSEESETKAE